jgi:hypothetical protein
MLRIPTPPKQGKFPAGFDAHQSFPNGIPRNLWVPLVTSMGFRGKMVLRNKKYFYFYFYSLILKKISAFF